MEDYEIRDVMFREQTPDIVINFLIHITDESRELVIQAHNNGSAFAQFVAVFLDVPTQLLPPVQNKMNLKDGGKMYRHRLTNLNQEFADEQFRSSFPLLRNMSMSWRITLGNEAQLLGKSDLTLKFKIYADNAVPKESRVLFREIENVDLRSQRDKV